MKNKNIIITGGAKGIGNACVKEFLKYNYNIIIIDKQKINVNDDSKNIIYYNCDISNELEVKNCMKEIKKKYKTIDVLINNAGIQISGKFNEYDSSCWKKVMETNYFGTCNMISNVIKMMKKDSTILNILSVHSLLPRINKYVYDSSKSAIEMLTKELALEFAEKKITINALSFGAVNTEMNKEWKTFPEKKQIAISKVPLKIIFEPQQIAKFCYIIINEFSKYTTGSIFIIDGGRHLL